MDSREPVGLVRRVAAKITDAVLLAFLAGSLAATLITLSEGPRFWNAAQHSATATGLAFFLSFIFLAPLLFVIFQAASLSVWGATPGKLLWGLDVITAEGGRPGILASLKRTLAEFVPFGYLAIFADVSRRAWHDRVSGTTVVPALTDSARRAGFLRSRRAWGVAAATMMIASGIVANALAPLFHSQSMSPADRHILVGVDALGAGDHAAAVGAFSSAIALDPKSSLAYANRASTFGRMGDRERQMADYARALDLDSAQVWALLGRADALRLEGELDRSSADYSRLIRLRPDWAGLIYAYRGRGSNVFRQDQYREAAEDFGLGEQSKALDSVALDVGNFYEALSMCRLFRSEALRRVGHGAAADSTLASLMAEVAGHYQFSDSLSARFGPGLADVGVDGRLTSLTPALKAERDFAKWKRDWLGE